MIYNSRPNRTRGIQMRGPMPYMMRQNMYHFNRKQNGHGGGGYGPGPGNADFQPYLPFDMMQFPTTFSMYTEETGLNEALVQRVAELTPSTEEKKVLSGFVTRVLTCLQTCIQEPTTAPNLELEEVKAVGAFKNEVLLAGDRKAKIVVLLRSKAIRGVVEDLSKLLIEKCQPVEPKNKRQVVCALRPYGLIMKETDIKGAKATLAALNEASLLENDGFVPGTDDGFGDQEESNTDISVDPNAYWLEVHVAMSTKRNYKKPEESTDKTQSSETGDASIKEEPQVKAEPVMSDKDSVEIPRWRQRTALLDLRRLRWFEEHANHEVIKSIYRLITDLTRRFPAFDLLRSLPWCIEVLAQFAACICPTLYAQDGSGKRLPRSASDQSPLDIGVAFRRLIQLLATGLFLPGSAGLMDPCINVNQGSAASRLNLRLNLVQLDQLSCMAHLLERLVIGYGMFDLVFCNVNYRQPGEMENMLAMASARSGVLIELGEAVITEADYAEKRARHNQNGTNAASGEQTTEEEASVAMATDATGDKKADAQATGSLPRRRRTRRGSIGEDEEFKDCSGGDLEDSLVAE